VQLKGTFVLLGLDESDDKQLVINVRYDNKSKHEVVTDFLERKYTAQPNAEEIAGHTVELSANLVLSCSKWWV